MKISIIPPSLKLNEFVKHYWIVEDLNNINPVNERIIPYGSIELIFHFGDRVLQTGPEGNSVLQAHSMLCGQKNQFNDILTTGKLGIFAVSFFPHSAGSFFRFPMHEILNRQLTLTDYLGDNARLIEEQMILSKDHFTRVRIIESYLLKWLKLNELDFKRTRESIRQIFLSKGQVSISMLSNHLCIGNRQFERLFSSHVGITAKQFQRIVRFHNILTTRRFTNFSSFTTLAHECGYYDQSHFIADFKLFTGHSPKDFFRIYGNCPESDLQV